MDSYNSKYPLEYYEVGTPYMFYSSNLPQEAEAATLEQVETYESILTETAKKEGHSNSFAKRLVGIVVDKESHDGIHPYSDIVVMFRATVDEKPVYVTTKYIVGHTGVFCDDKEQLEASGSVDLTGKISIDFSHQQCGDGSDDIGRHGKSGGGDGTKDVGRHEKNNGVSDDLGRRKK